MQRYKEIVTWLLAFVLAFSLVGCSGVSESTSNESDKKIDQKENTNKKEEKDSKEKQEAEVAQTEPAPGNEQTPAAPPAPAVQQQAAKTEVNSNKQATNNTQPAQQPQAPSAPAPSQQPPAQVTKPEPVHAVTISIIGHKGQKILDPTQVNINAGDTVLDALLKTGKDVVKSGSGATAYVEGIENLYELDYGSQSGWTYKLNGTQVQKSADVVEMKDGDQIVWVYVEG